MADEKIEAERIEAYGISEDGSMVRLKLSTKEDGGEVYLTMPSGNVPEFYREIGNVLAKLKAGGVVQPGAGGLPRQPGSWTVGYLHDAPGHTMLMFDKAKPEEVVYVFSDIDALKLADGIERGVFARMSMADRRKIMMEREKAAKERIIMPGQPGFEAPN